MTTRERGVNAIRDDDFTANDANIMNRKKLLYLLLFTAVPVALLFAGTGISFSKFSSKEGSFTILMPGEP
jgi:hypothetical protein